MSENACQRRILFSFVAFAFVCIALSAVLLVAVFHLFTFSADCVKCRSHLRLLGIVAAATFSSGLLILLIRLLMLCYKRRYIYQTQQVAVSLIPAEDLEKSAAPILPLVLVPHRLPFIDTSSIDSLPDYFTVVQNPDDAYLYLDANVWIENVSETPPPSYEEAIEMSRLTTVTTRQSHEV